MEGNTLAQWGLLIVIVIGIVIAFDVPTNSPFADRPNITEINFSTPQPTPMRTVLFVSAPTPIVSVTIPQPTQTPSPFSPPTPTPTVSEPPLVLDWMEYGYKCEVPTHLIGEKWVEEYKFECACIIRGKYDLGVYYNVWESCFQFTSSGWRRESCECLEIICVGREDLC